MATETVSVVGRSDLIVSKQSKRTYFTITDDTDRKLICFNPSYYNKLEIGSVVDLDVQPGRSADDTPRIEKLIGLEELEPEEDKPTPPPPKHKEAPHLRNKAFALSYAKDLAVASVIKGNQIIFTAEMFNQYLSGNITVPEEVLIKYVQEQVKAEMKEG